jgi:hypothetical protein
MRMEEILSPDAVRWINKDEIRQLLAAKVAKMPDETAELLFSLLQDAFDRGESAGHRGDHHDGGCRHQLSQVEMFVHGWFKLIPRDWQALQSKIIARHDPEWSEYQRLKEKFKGRG